MEFAKLKERVEELLQEMTKAQAVMTEGEIREMNEISEQVWKLLKEGNLETFYSLIPFTMEFETRYHAKEHYQDIQTALKQVSGRVEDILSDSKANQKDLSLYMTALADSGSAISEEVYDHYKNIVNAFKKVLHAVAGEVQGWDEESRLRMSYAILKACNSRMILVEKYRPLGQQLFEAVSKQAPSGQKTLWDKTQKEYQISREGR